MRQVEEIQVKLLYLLYAQNAMSMKNGCRTGQGEMFIKRTRDEQIASFIGSIQANEDDSFKKRFISMLSALDESEWEVLEKMVIMLYEKKD